MTLIEKNFQKLAQAVIIKAYKDNSKELIEDECNFNLLCGLALVDPKEIKKKFLNLKEKEDILPKGSKTKIAHNLGVSYATLDYWHRKYDDLDRAIEYIKSGDHKYQTHSICDKCYDQIVKMRKEKKSWKDISIELNIGYNTLYGFGQKVGIK